MGAFATLYLASSARPIGPGSTKPASTGATACVCVHVPNETDLNELVFAIEPEVDTATMHYHLVGLPPHYITFYLLGISSSAQGVHFIVTMAAAELVTVTRPERRRWGRETAVTSAAAGNARRTGRRLS
jgi:hypothetical protein